MFGMRQGSIVTDRSADELRTAYKKCAILSRVRSPSEDCISFYMRGGPGPERSTPVLKVDIRIKPHASGQNELDVCIRPLFIFYIMLGSMVSILPQQIWCFVVRGTSLGFVVCLLVGVAMIVASNYSQQEFCMKKLERVSS